MTEHQWHAHYDPGVPTSLNYPDQPVDVFLRQTAQKFPDHPALIFGGMVPLLGEQHRTINYRELDEMVDRFAAGLQRLGLRPGDRVIVYMPNCPQLVAAYYGTLRAGGVVVPSNPLYVAHEIEHQLNDSGARFAVVLSMLYPIVAQVRANTALDHVVVANIKTYFPRLLRRLFELAKEKQQGHRIDLAGQANTHRFRDVAGVAGAVPRAVTPAANDTAVLMYTGGTTGVPKGAELTHANVIANGLQASAWMMGGEA